MPNNLTAIKMKKQSAHNSKLQTPIAWICCGLFTTFCTTRRTTRTSAQLLKSNGYNKSDGFCAIGLYIPRNWARVVTSKTGDSKQHCSIALRAPCCYSAWPLLLRVVLIGRQTSLMMNVRTMTPRWYRTSLLYTQLEYIYIYIYIEVITLPYQLIGSCWPPLLQ